MSNSRFCCTLDVLTDGSEHTGCGTLFLSVWKIPVSVWTAAARNNNNNNESRSSSGVGDSGSSSGSYSSGSDEESDPQSGDSDETDDDDDDDDDDEAPGISNEARDHHTWLTGSDEHEHERESHSPAHVPVARYALSGVGDATARLCADQRFKLAPTRACFVPALGTDAAAADGLSALLLALFGAGSPSLHVVVPSSFARGSNSNNHNSNSNSNSNNNHNNHNNHHHRSNHDLSTRGGGGDDDDGGGGGAFVEELATITLGAHKRFDIRTCEVRPSDDGDDDEDSVTWWKVYEDEFLLVHASSSKGLSSLGSSIVYLYSFSSSRSGTKKEMSRAKDSYCTLAIFPPGCKNVADGFEKLVRKNLPMIRDGVSTTSIDYVIVLDPREQVSTTSMASSSDRGNTDNADKLLFRLAKRNRVLVTLPRNSNITSSNNDNNNNNDDNRHHACVGEGESCSGSIIDEGILMRSQQLHRQLYRCMPRAFVEPRTMPVAKTVTGVLGEESTNQWVGLRSGTSLFLEPIGNNSHQPQAAPNVWDRRKGIWKKELKEEWTKETIKSLESFLDEKEPSKGENEIDPDGKINGEKQDLTAEENEIDLDDDGEISATRDLINDDNEIDLEDENEIDLDDENEIDLDDENEIDLGEGNELRDITAKDDNEINLDLDEENDSSEQEENIPLPVHLPNPIDTGGHILHDRLYDASGGPGSRLLVLGTGCATPSAYRGASGYALILQTELASESEPTRTGMPMPRQNQHCCFERGDHPRRHPTGGDTTDVVVEEKEQIFLLDCGEGVSTMLSRNCGRVTDWATKVQGIWISHAHLDHYGGLPTLLRILWRERQRERHDSSRKTGSTERDDIHRRKRQKQSRSPTDLSVPWVMAPAKVLRYLDLVLDCRYGHSRNTNTDNTSGGIKTTCFEPRLHHDPRIPRGPFFRFENIKVYHNCGPAYGLLIGWETKTTSGNAHARARARRFLCYSGDTRPTRNLVQACRRALHGHGYGHGRTTTTTTTTTTTSANDKASSSPDLILIHEATYRDAESSMASRKKHSTLAEARAVAVDTGCSRVLMSHFSQRYDTAFAKSAEQNDNDNDKSDATEETDRVERASNPRVGLAVDGLWIPLDHSQTQSKGGATKL